MINRLRRCATSREESGQALAIVMIVIFLLLAFSVSLANQSNEQAPIAAQSVLARLAMQAAQAGLADYQDFISANPENAASFCSSTTFTACTGESTTIASGSNGVALPSATIDVGSTSSFSISAIISVSSSAGQQSVTCTGTSTSPVGFTGCSGGTGTLATGSTVTQYELPGGVDPAFQNAFTTSGLCSGNTASSGWATASITSLGGQNAAYQYLVNSSALEGGASGGEVDVYATGRAGVSGNYVCRSVQASFFVQMTQPGVPQTVATNDSYSSIDVPSSCQSSCTTTTATITVAGASGGSGGTGASGTGGSGGAGEEIQATFQIPTGMSLATDIGYEGMTASGNSDPSTTISSITGACATALPIGSTGEICVASTAGFQLPIAIYVTNSSKTAQLVTCDTDTSTTFTNCSGGSGSLAVGGSVSQPWSSGYGAGGASGNPGGGYSYGGSYSSSGSGGGASAVCLETSSGTTCDSTTPLCVGAVTSASAPCALIVGAGGGGAGEGGHGGSAGNGGNGGNPSGAFPATVTSANDLTTAQAEGYTDAGSSGGSGYASSGQQTGAAGGGAWVPSATASSNTATGGSAGTSESIFGDSTPAGSPGQPNSSGSPATVTVTSMTGSHSGANGPAFSGDGCFWWCSGADGGGGGGGLSGGGSGGSGGDGGAGAGGGGASYFDVGALYTPSTGACSSGPCLVVGTATAGNGFANFTVQNVTNSTIPTAKTQCLNDGGGGTYSPCSPTFDPDPTWYTTAPSSPCSTTCDSAGQLESCGTAYTTEAPPGAYTGQAWMYGGGGGGGYGGSPVGGSGGNGAAALVDFNAVPDDFYAVNIGCGGGGGGTSTAGTGVEGGGKGSSKTGGGGGATVLCFEGTSATASCSYTTAGCSTTTTTPTSSPCILSIVGGGGGGKTAAGAGGGPTGSGTSTTWCSTNSFTSYCNGNAGFNATTAGGGGAGGASWFATNSTNTAPVESFALSASEPCTSTTITNVSQSCLINTSETAFPPALSADTPCGGTGTPAYNNNESEDTSQSTNGGTAGAGQGCGGYSPTTAATGYQGYAGQLGYWGGSASSTATSYTAYYGWVNWTVYTPALESGACDFKSPASTPWGPPTPNSQTISVPNTGTYTLTVGGGSGATGWQTAGAGKFGTGGSGSELTFKATLTALQQLTVVAGCGGFGNLGGLGFGNGGSSGFQPQGTYISDSDPVNGTPVVNGAGGGGGGASALCLSNSNVTSPTCTSSTPLCTDTSPGSGVTCVLAIAGGGGGGGTDYVCSGASCPQLALNTDCTTTGSDLNGGGGLGTTASANSFSGSWSPGTEGSGGASTTHYYYGAGTAGATGGSSSTTSSGQPQSYSGSNPAPNSATGGSVSNGGNGGWYLGSGILTTYGGIGAGGGGGGFQGGWADPWEPSGQAVPTDANPNATSTSNQFLTGSSGSAAECGAGGGSSWLTGVATNVQTGGNSSTNGTVTVLYDPPGSSQISSSSQVPVYQNTW